MPESANSPQISTQDPSNRPKLYFIDGYHGGVKGHMALGSWRDIFSVMRHRPEWKICIDIEPISWTPLRRRDPAVYEELKQYMEDQSIEARAEMVSASYAQPYGWVIGGESNIRHLTRGIEILREHFPCIIVDSYAVQEPCWTSSMPQILKSLGFKRAVLKDPSTAWGGYSAGFDADVLWWVGPDGTPIPCVPRYACEELMNAWETEAAHATPEFMRKCIEKGITKPTGMYFQDCGWPAKPRVEGDHIQYATWREYVEKIAPKPEKEWRFSQEDILCTLPWGEQTLQRLARYVRSAENKIVLTEKLAAVAAVLRKTEWPAEDFQKAWDQLLLAQHHDAWICARSRGGRMNWAWQVGAETWAAEEICDALNADRLEILSTDSAKIDPSFEGSRWFRVFNTLASNRNEVGEVMLTMGRGTRAVRIFNADGREVPAQVVMTRKYMQDESINAARVLFQAEVPSMGYTTYRWEPVKEPAQAEGAKVTLEADDTIAKIETDLYSITLDGKQGGVITSLYAKELNKEFVDTSHKRLFNEYRGYFIEEKQWISSADAPVKFNIIENGPLRVKLSIVGSIAGNMYSSTITLYQGQRRIDFHFGIGFKKDTYIGEEIEIKPEDRRAQRIKSHHDSQYKLQAIFPATLQNRTLFKNAAYDVCQSKLENTFFKSWAEIKHNIILNWVDVVDETQDVGLALFSDHTTSYSHGKEYPLALVLGWGGEGGSWWGKCALRDHQEAAYSLIPHSGKWDGAQISAECARWSEPLLTQRMAGEPGNTASESLLKVSSPGIEVPTMLVDGKDLLVRLFNAEGDENPFAVSLAAKSAKVEMAELDGRSIGQMEASISQNGRTEVQLSMPRFGLRTIRFCGVI